MKSCGIRWSSFFAAIVLSAIAPQCRADLLALYRFENSLTADSAFKLGTFHAQSFNAVAGGNAALDASSGAPGIGSGASAQFDGTGDFLDLPINAVNPFNGTQDFSVTVWFKTPGNADKSVLLSSARNNVGANHALAFHTGDSCCSQGFANALHVDNFFVSQVSIGGNGAQTGGAPSQSLEDNSWRFGAVTFSAATQRYTIYTSAPGGPTYSNSAVFSPAIPNIALDTVRVGDTVNADFPAPGDFAGNMDDLAIFNHALSGAELANIQAGNFSAYNDANVQIGGANTIGTMNLSATVTEQTIAPAANIERVIVQQLSKTAYGNPSDDDYLSLRELQAFDSNGTNVALAANGGVASSTSLWPGGIHPIAALNDGVTNVGGGGGIAHTGEPPLTEESMQIAFDGGKDLTSIRLFARGDCCPYQYNNLMVELYDANGLVASHAVTGMAQFGDKVVDVTTIVGGTATGSLTAGGIYHAEIDAASLTSDSIVVPLVGTAADTKLVVTGDLVVTANGSIAPGTTFQLLTADAIEGTFGNLTLPGGAAAWDTSNLYVTGQITYVPEPSSLLLMAVGAFGIYAVRRR